MRRILILVMALLSIRAHAGITVTDDTGVAVTLSQPAQRIVSLAPHVTELLFAAGGGNRIVGTVRFSDYPTAARRIPRVGDNLRVDLERIVALKPDLLIVWRHNASERQTEQLRRLGIPLFYSEPKTLADIPETLLRFAALMGTIEQAREPVDALRARMDDLAMRYGNRPPVRVFYQVWDKPLYTLNHAHITSDVIRFCGGINIFAHASASVPSPSMETILQENPEVIITGDQRGNETSGIESWRQYPSLQAVRRNNLFALDADLLHRASPRILEGAAQLCEKLELARQRRGDRQ